MTPELIFGLVGLLIGILSVGAALAWLIVAGLASLRADLRERTGQLDSRIGTLDTRIGGLETRMSAMEARMSAMEARMSAMERELSRTQGFLDNLRPASPGASEAD